MVFPVIGLVLFTVVLLEGVATVIGTKRVWLPTVALVIAAIAFVPPSRDTSRRFSDASVLVQATLLDIERETAHLPDGARVLVQNLPESQLGPPPFFRLALQSALQRPFMQSDVARRLTVETQRTPGTYDLILKF